MAAIVEYYPEVNTSHRVKIHRILQALSVPYVFFFTEHYYDLSIHFYRCKVAMIIKKTIENGCAQRRLSVELYEYILVNTALGK